ncbi:MAG: class 3 adenylate cyclase [Parasphingorhabdus sp.]
MSDITEWLSELGLEKYNSAFNEAEIAFSDLPYLTDEDLKEVGLPVGPRRRVKEAIKDLRSSASPVAESANSESVTPEPAEIASVPVETSSPNSDAERRHLTVMFIDLVGSTEMAGRIDVEDMRNIITSYQNAVAGVVTRYAGFVAKFMGDGVLCYFGWPRASEDDAERAVHAGLDIIASVKILSEPGGTPLATRIGIATGVVIVGDLIGSGATQEAAVVGETPNLAARLQGIAKPNQLVLPKKTRSLLGNSFELESVGLHTLKGISEPVKAYSVVGEARMESRFAARQTGSLTPIVGRDQELGLMRQCWVRTKASSGQMVLVSGEAGIGKSRITRALIDEISQDKHIRMTYQCSPYHTDSAFYPVIQQLNYAAGIQANDSYKDRLEKLERVAGINVANSALIATLLGIDFGERYPALNLSPALVRIRTMQALIKILVLQAQEKPLLAVFEDLHWIDPTTLELLELALDSIPNQKIFILATARPSFEHGFGGHPLVTRFALNRLGGEQISSIVNKLTGGKPLPDEVLQIIATRTDGVPLFIEELTKTIIETEVLKEQDDRFVLAGSLDTLAIPSTLHDSLMARLDRLQPIKEVAQMAACIGREFDHRLLENISPLPEKELGAALEGLIKSELIYRRGLPPEASYLFKHALVRDAAYESLLKERRREIHVSILSALEAEADVIPEVLAVHAEAAGLIDRAIDLWEVASKAALARPAYYEAISHLEHAIALITPRLEIGKREDLERALSLQVPLGFTSLSSRGYGADETKSAFEYALLLADRIGETPLRYSVLYGLWAGMYVRAEHAGALLQARAISQLVENSTESAPILVANRLVGVGLCFQGSFAEAKLSLDCAKSYYDPVKHKGLEARFGQDLGVTVYIYSAINSYLLGYTQQAEKDILVVECIALATGHANTIAYMHMHCALYALIADQDSARERHASALSVLAAEHHMDLFQDYAAILQSLVAAGAGDPTGIEAYIEADNHFVSTKSQVYTPLTRVAAGWLALSLGLGDRARELASMAETMMDETGDKLVLSDLFRLQGALALEAGDQHSAESHLQRAIEVAQEQGSKMWQLRGAIDLARLQHEAGRTTEAVLVLKPIVEIIADGDCANDHVTAKALLVEFAK